MDIRKVKKLMDLLEQSGMAEIEIHEGEESVRICRHGNTPILAAAPVAAVAPATPTPIAPATNTTDTPATANTQTITSPMVGTFYASAAPTSPAFVKIGDQVNQGDIICIVEAMKIMNQIEADQSGTVVEVLCSDGDAVEFGQTLMIVE